MVKYFSGKRCFLKYFSPVGVRSFDCVGVILVNYNFSSFVDPPPWSNYFLLCAPTDGALTNGSNN